MAQFEIKDGVAIIPEGTKTIPSDAFKGCTELINVVILDSVTEIGECVFEYCKNLKTITLPAGVDMIDESVFEGCDNIETIYVPAKKDDYYKKCLPEELHDNIVEISIDKK